MQDYRKLLVWRKAHALVLNVRKSSQRFPASGSIMTIADWKFLSEETVAIRRMLCVLRKKVLAADAAD